MNKRLSDEGLALCKLSEHFCNLMYNCPAGHCTIGFGHLIHKGPVCTGKNITDAQMKPFDLTVAQARALETPWVNGITYEQGVALLRRDMARYEAVVNSVVKVAITQAEFDALTDFEYNTGHLPGSTLLKKLNAGDFKGAAAEFDVWVYANHQKLNGLVTRRAAERKLFERDLK